MLSKYETKIVYVLLRFIIAREKEELEKGDGEKQKQTYFINHFIESK